MRSNMIKVGVDRAPHRSLLYATGKVKTSDLEKPFIGVCNSYIDIIPGHVHFREFRDVVSERVIMASGIPFKLRLLVIDDGISTRLISMRYALLSRELLTSSAESIINAPWFDGVL